MINMCEQLAKIKHENKETFAKYVKDTTSLVLNTDSIFDVGKTLA